MVKDAEYITDAEGNRTKIVLPIEVFEEIMDDLLTIAAVEEARHEPKRLLSEIIAEMRANGEIDV